MNRTLPPLSILLALLVSSAPAGEQGPKPVHLGQPVKPIVVPSWHRTSIAFSPDGTKLAWVHNQPDRLPNDGGGLVIHLWDIDKRIPLVEMKPANEFTYACSPVCFLPNGRMVAVGCFQLMTEHEQLAKAGTTVHNSVRVWLAASGRELPIMQREGAIKEEIWQAAAVSPDGKTITAVSSKAGRVWKMPEGEVVRRFEFESATGLVLSPDSKLAAGVAKDQSVRVWTTEDGKETAKLPGSGRVLGLSSDAKQLATVHEDRVCLWDIESAKQLWSAPGKLEKEVSGFAFSAAGKFLAWNDDGKITVAEAVTGKVATNFKGQPGPLAFSHDGRRLALACPDGTALVWDLPK